MTTLWRRCDEDITGYFSFSPQLAQMGQLKACFFLRQLQKKTSSLSEGKEYHPWQKIGGLIAKHKLVINSIVWSLSCLRPPCLVWPAETETDRDRDRGPVCSHALSCGLYTTSKQPGPQNQAEKGEKGEQERWREWREREKERDGVRHVQRQRKPLFFSSRLLGN